MRKHGLVILLALLALCLTGAEFVVTFTSTGDPTDNYRVWVRVLPSPWPTAGVDVPVTPTQGAGTLGAHIAVDATTGQTVEFGVTAYDSGGESEMSNTIAVVVQGSPTMTPSASSTITASRTATMTMSATRSATPTWTSAPPTATRTATPTATRTKKKPVLNRVDQVG